MALRRRTHRRRPGFLALAAAAFLTLAPLPTFAADEPAPSPSAAILQDLRRLANTGTVLYVAAHPDDENTQLITYFARGRGYRTAYLSLTRGDGGQNVIGGEFSEQLGLIRTHELLEARKLDGGRQFFTRAIDFGFSKQADETLRIWNRNEVLSDVVRVIRTFRPDVIVTRFSPEPGGTHGHHTSSAILALEAFKLAGDPSAFPEQLKTLKPWQPKRILQNGRGSGELQIDVSGTDPVTGETFSRIASRSRGMHKSQGFGNFGAGSDRAARPESFQLLAGDPADKDPFDGVDTTWARIPNAADVGQAIDAIIKAFDPKKPDASVPALLDLRKRLAALPKDPLVDEKRTDLDRILQSCLGLTVQTTTPDAEVVPGEPLKLHFSATIRSDHPIKWLTTLPNAKQRGATVDLKPNQPASRDVELTLPADMPLTQPYWLRADGADGISTVEDPQLIGLPENPPAFPVGYLFEIAGQQLFIPDSPVGATDKRALEVIPPVSLHPVTEVCLFRPGGGDVVEIEVTAARDNLVGKLRLDVPTGWNVEPATQNIHLRKQGDKQKIAFSVEAPSQHITALLSGVTEVDGHEYHTGRFDIRYKHIPQLLLQPPARIRAVVTDVRHVGDSVGYLPGAGDSGAEALEEIGYKVTRLTPTDLTTEKLATFDAIVVGVRAFNVRKDLAEITPKLFAYVETGGTLVVQYNRPGDFKAAPYNLRVGNLRVTDENAPVTFLAPDHPALNTPNKITEADFANWVQERGLYFPGEWAKEFTPLLAMNDPGDEPLKGSLLVAPHGKGHVVYTGLAFFRQLPAGVPGAYRLFANLVSLGK